MILLYALPITAALVYAARAVRYWRLAPWRAQHAADPVLPAPDEWPDPV